MPGGTEIPGILAIDIGGSGIKALVLDAEGRPVSERRRLATPARSTPRAILRIIARLAEGLPAFDRVSVGFPGVVAGAARERQALRDTLRMRG